MRKIIILSISIFFAGCVNKQDPVYKKYHTMSCSEIAQEHKKGFDYLQNKGKEDRKKIQSLII